MDSHVHEHLDVQLSLLRYRHLGPPPALKPERHATPQPESAVATFIAVVRDFVSEFEWEVVKRCLSIRPAFEHGWTSLPDWGARTDETGLGTLTETQSSSSALHQTN